MPEEIQAWENEGGFCAPEPELVAPAPAISVASTFADYADSFIRAFANAPEFLQIP